MNIKPTFEVISTSHSDLIHDVQYNHYGNKLASCSSDQSIRVWELQPSGQWVQTAEWKAHDGSVWKIAWAPPEYGDIFATASYDRTVIVWERSAVKVGPKGMAKWASRARLVDARQSVTDIAFAPKHLGMQLATSSSDGSVRVYEAVDVMNLMHWPLVDEFEVTRDGGGVSCISWSPSQFGPPSLVVGTDRRVQIWRYSESQKKWAPSDSAGFNHEPLQSESPLNDVAWAPNLGRSYELIATASQDRLVRIWKVTPAPTGGDTMEIAATFRDHKSEVWHVEWNVTGTVLASSGDDAVVRLWSKDANGEWKAVSQIDAIN